MRPYRQTSTEAHESVKEHKQRMYERIAAALSVMKIGGTFEEIAEVSGLKPDQVWKRLPEMIEAGKVYNVGITRPTSSGRKAMVRQLTSFKEVKQLQLL
jgi:biotin synthase-related radical SAM superfamily protein